MKIANCLLIAASALAVVACTSVRPAALPDGTMGYAFECNGMQDAVDECYARIARLCPRGFDIVAQSHSSLMTFDPFERMLYVRCRKPVG